MLPNGDLELKLETELNLPLSVRQCLGDGSTSARTPAAISRSSRNRRHAVEIDNASPAATATRSYVRKVEARVVEDVKELGSEHQSKSLA